MPDGLKDTVQRLILTLDQHTGPALALVMLLAGAWLGWKLWQKRRFSRLSELPHITPDELVAAMNTEARPLVLDLRSAALIAETGPIPGATVAEHDQLRRAIGDWPKHRPIVTLCACPEDAGAIQAARRLLDSGYLSVRPLQDGYDAWVTATAPRAPERSSAVA